MVLGGNKQYWRPIFVFRSPPPTDPTTEIRSSSLDNGNSVPNSLVSRNCVVGGGPKGETKSPKVGGTSSVGDRNCESKGCCQGMDGWLGEK